MNTNINEIIKNIGVTTYDNSVLIPLDPMLNGYYITNICMTLVTTNPDVGFINDRSYNITKLDDISNLLNNSNSFSRAFSDNDYYNETSVNTVVYELSNVEGSSKLRIRKHGHSYNLSLGNERLKDVEVYRNEVNGSSNDDMSERIRREEENKRQINMLLLLAAIG